MENIERTASSARVFNINACTKLGIRQSGDAPFEPLFQHNSLNHVIALKSRLRGGELDLYTDRRQVATKIFFPFNYHSLKEGGTFVFWGEENLNRLLDETIGIDLYSTDEKVRHDIEILNVIDRIPSLDPFLLKEVLRVNGVEPDKIYFNIQPSEWISVRNEVLEEFKLLAAIAFKGQPDVEAQAEILTDKMWEGTDIEALMPLIKAMNISIEHCAEIMFAWKGIIYYKYQYKALEEPIQVLLQDLEAFRVYGYQDLEERDTIQEIRGIVIASLKREAKAVGNVIATYVEAFREKFIREGQPGQFIALLKDAPGMFNELGYKMAAIQHASSYWTFAHGANATGSIQAEEFINILNDFLYGLTAQSD